MQAHLFYGRTVVAEHADEPARFIGQELFDANRAKIGLIAGLGFARKKFGTWWLAVETPDGATLLVPAEPVRLLGDRLTLPYMKGYVMSGPSVEPGRPPSKEDEHRLAVRYGFANRVPTGECAQCGFCMAMRRAERQKSGCAT